MNDIKETSIPPSDWNGKAVKLTQYRQLGSDDEGEPLPLKIVGEKNVTRITQYGSIVFVQSKFGSRQYGRVCTASGYYIPSPFDRGITGRIREARKVVQKMAQVTNWDKFNDLSQEQKAEIHKQYREVCDSFPVYV